MPPVPMVPPPSNIGQRLWEWILTGPVGQWLKEQVRQWLLSVSTRGLRLMEVWDVLHKNFALIPMLIFGILFPIWILYLVGIVPEVIVLPILTLLRALGGDPAGAAVMLFARIYRDNAVSNTANELVNFIFDDMTKLLGGKLGSLELSPSESGAELSRKIAQLAIAQSLSSYVAGLIIPWMGRILSSIYGNMYWSLGLGFLAWQSMAPFLQVAVQEPQQKYLNKNYRPNWITPSQAFSLAATAQDSFENAMVVARYAGMPESQAHKMLQASFREISESDLFALYEAGKISHGELVLRLRRLGYRPEDIDKVIAANTVSPQKEPRQVALSTLRAALRKGLITPDRFRELAKKIPLSDEEIDLLIAIETFQKQEEARQVTTGQIEAAFKAGVLREPEARGYLRALRYEDAVIDLLIRTWREELQPKPFLLNAGRLADAFEFGVITEAQFMEKLLALGWDPDDARIFIDTVKERLKRRERPGETQRARKPTAAMILTFMTQGIIDSTEAFNNLREIGYDEDTAKRLIRSALMEPPRESRKLSVSNILEAYRKGLLVREEAIQRLVDLQYSREDAEILVNMEEDAIGASDLILAYHNNLIDLPTLYNGLIAAGYPRSRVIAFLKSQILPANFTDTFLAWTKGVLTAHQARQILIALGFPMEQIDQFIPPEEVA